MLLSETLQNDGGYCQEIQESSGIKGIFNHSLNKGTNFIKLVRRYGQTLKKSTQSWVPFSQTRLISRLNGWCPRSMINVPVQWQNKVPCQVTEAPLWSRYCLFINQLHTINRNTKITIYLENKAYGGGRENSLIRLCKN